MSQPHNSFIACVAGVERGRGRGKGGREKGEGDWGEGTPALRTPFLFISADAGVRKFLIG